MTKYEISPDGRAITCGECGLTSHNPHDVAHRYCGNCHVFHDDVPAPPIGSASGMGYWMFDTSGVLRPAVEAYLHNGNMAPEQIAALRAYLRQWIFSPFWRGDELDELRRGIDGLTSRAAIDAWLDAAEMAGIDPL
jgi:hypothetical protein